MRGVFEAGGLGGEPPPNLPLIGGGLSGEWGEVSHKLDLFLPL